ncbi:carbohydrate ABC transporter permease [Pengzhenrongella sicca]|uniref:Sugar ABC transporter permease n=1 Tax=Pengzhenrongella sicca TaxID=2819238 RepID=A0A8A4ZFB4_9MICO|nr:sugar ABC transporter permease [Pengzhenrongella sicca]QTE29187.1 sugar ABC transporter permease [Pengzhenrongella sicca]
MTSSTVIAGAAVAAAPGRPRRRRRRGSFTGLWFVLPATLVIGVFTLIPVGYGLLLSFTEYSPLSRSGPEFVGLENYAGLLHDPQFRQSIGVTVRYTAQVLPLLVVLALALAVLANKPFRGVGLLRAGLYLPHIVSLTAVSMIWLWLYSRDGLVNEALDLLGLGSQRWLYEPDTALNAVSVMRIWKALGSNMVLLLAGLQAIPQHLYEAARCDGASAWQQFRYVTLPGLRTMLVYVVTMDVIYLSQSFAEIFVLTQGGPLGATTTANFLIYEEAFQANQMGGASAMAFVLFALIAGFSFVSIRAMAGRNR